MVQRQLIGGFDTFFVTNDVGRGRSALRKKRHLHQVHLGWYGAQRVYNREKAIGSLWLHQVLSQGQTIIKGNSKQAFEAKKQTNKHFGFVQEF
ncbi:uncharacterized protein N7487_003054 [Penicillium crustosum]|uniref:uncharacterized protein n=1 Tax=Penicillium crustosum TaxID=36656 RepID=UPI00239C0586|nr:uncharacterized protein N7487_003054 [Penicillium crustosum]KAJ5419504.1 hypothetical protein N7487_003054 [Penicillium crustosum]